MPANDLTGHLYRQRKATAPRPSTSPAPAPGKSRFAFDGFTFFVGVLLAAALALQFALMLL